ncbi:MAG: hypothetical protein Q4F69_06290 [Bacteroidia bacterium]|nr:hypothetical protein [Bacteroidia bacterium]
MKIIYNILILTLLSTNLAIGQVMEYRCNTFDESTFLYIDFYENDFYIFGYRTDYKDMFFESIISEGIYINKQNDTIVLNDQVNGFDMIFRRDGNDSLYCVNGLCFMDTLRLVYHGMCDEAYDGIYYTLKYEHPLDSLEIEREIYRSQTVLRDFKPGLYEIYHPGDQLSINEDHTYTFPSAIHPMTAGTWKREGNLLTFFDKSLGEAFTAFIEDGYILARHLFYYSKFDKYRIIPENEYYEYYDTISAKQR